MNEYKIVRVPYDSAMAQAEDMINTLAQAGWEVIAVTCPPADPDSVFLTVRHSEPGAQNSTKPAKIRNDDADGETELLLKAAEYALEHGQITVDKLQAHLALDPADAQRIVSALETNGIVEHSEGLLPHRVCMSDAEFSEWKRRLYRADAEAD